MYVQLARSDHTHVVQRLSKCLTQAVDSRTGGDHEAAARNEKYVQQLVTKAIVCVIKDFSFISYTKRICGMHPHSNYLESLSGQ
jgi:hypothetical protein